MASQSIQRIAMVRLAIFLGVVALIGWFFRGALMRVVTLLLGSGTLAFLIAPAVTLFGKKLSRGAAIVCAYVAVALVAAAFLIILLPSMINQSAEIIGGLPELFLDWQRTLKHWGRDLSAMGLPDPFSGIGPDLSDQAIKAITSLVPGTLSFAGNMFEGASLTMLMVMLSYYFLLERDEIFMRLEMLIPLKWRKDCVFYCVELKCELAAFVKGQLIIAAIVGTLTALGLLIVGIRGYAVLGVIMGICNLIPYFGPLIGSIPTLFIAFGQGGVALFSALLVVAIVQQIDVGLLAPMITGSSTRMSPIVVLIAISTGGSVAGLAGMLFAIPMTLVLRTIYKISERMRENN